MTTATLTVVMTQGSRAHDPYSRTRKLLLHAEGTRRTPNAGLWSQLMDRNWKPSLVTVGWSRFLLVAQSVISLPRSKRSLSGIKRTWVPHGAQCPLWPIATTRPTLLLRCIITSETGKT